MLSLSEIQRGFRDALLAKGTALDRHVVPAEGIDIHRNTVLVSLKTALRDTFPVVWQLVGEGFFLYAAEEFIHTHPPARPRLADYGGEFPAFLADFPPGRSLAYLPDVARLEWLMARAIGAEDTIPLRPDALTGIAAGETPRLTFHFDPSIAYLESPWPVDAIWRANQPGVADASVSLDGGGGFFEIRRHEDLVEMRALTGAAFAFREALSGGATLETATEAARDAHPAFPLAEALRDLFRDVAICGLALAEKP